MLEHNGLPWKFEPNFSGSSLPSILAPSFTLFLGRALFEWPFFGSVLGTRLFVNDRNNREMGARHRGR